MTSIARVKRQLPTLSEVLCYSPRPASRATVRRHYAKWRQEQGLTPLCDMPDCSLHVAPPVWKQKSLPLILDHSNGNNLDNRPENLRYLCPNCDSQLPTRGGLNRGRVRKAEEGQYTLLSKDGRTHFHLFVPSGTIRITGYPPTVTRTTNEPAK